MALPRALETRDVCDVCDVWLLFTAVSTQRNAHPSSALRGECKRGIASPYSDACQT